MKSQKYWFAGILVLAVSMLLFSISNVRAGQVTPDQKALIDLMKVDPSLAKQVTDQKVREKMKASLAQQVTADFDAMKLLFETKDFSSQAKLLEKRGAALTTPGFEKIRGADSSEFWKSVWKDAVELNLVPVSIVVSGAITPQPVPLSTLIDQGIMIRDENGNPIKYDAVAILTFEFHIVPKSRGTTFHNETGVCTATYFHKTVCPWG